MTIDDLKYPVLCFSQNLVSIENSSDGLTTCSKPALRKGGYFENLLLVDSNGTALKIKGAEKLHGVGPFRGYNVFFNQKIRVRLHREDAPFQVSFDEVKKRILDSFRRWHGWSSRDDFEELRLKVQNAKTIAEIIELIR